MKKFIYCLLPLFALQLNSCAPGKSFSREAFPKEPADPTIVTGFKNRITYKDGLINDTTSVTYDNNLPVALNYLEVGKRIPLLMASNVITENEYNKDDLLTFEKITTYSIEGNLSEIKIQDIHDLKYDKHKNIIEDTTTTKRYTSEEIREDVHKILTSYVYDENSNVTVCIEEVYENGDLVNKKIKEFTYDNQQRLIKAEAKAWGWNDNFYDPEGYSRLLKESHVYEGNKITDTSESLEKDEGVFKTKDKITKVCEYDSNYNLIHGLYVNYDLERPLQTATTEEFYEYNDKGLETYFKSYKTSGAESVISQFEYRTTTYCGPNNDKLESRIDTNIQVRKFNDSNAEKSQTKSIRNYYDDEQRVIRQEISEDPKGKLTQVTYLFEY